MEEKEKKKKLKEMEMKNALNSRYTVSKQVDQVPAGITGLRNIGNTCFLYTFPCHFKLSNIFCRNSVL